MKITFIIAGLIFASLTSTQSFGQQLTGDSVKLELFYRKILQSDSVTAHRVALIQADYKVAMKVLLSDGTLSDEAKRLRMKTLISAKNDKLRKILTPGQQEKIIPSTEI